MNLKSSKVQKYWGKTPTKIDYSQMDQSIIKKFNDTHPKVIEDWLPKERSLFKVDPNYELSFKQRKHRIMIRLENMLGLDLSKKHYKLLK